MKKTIKIASGLGLMLAFGLTSCNKYEDGPAISLRTKKERVANTWEIENAYRNGEEVTEDYEEYTLHMEKDGDAELAALYKWGDFSFEYETDGTWMFENDAKTLKLDYENDDADQDYQILRLAEKELWIREIGGEDELHLAPKK
ncbi:MAG: hypothetical protein ABJG68_06185 [Crocinitomicaceae bacterium]